MSAKLAEQVGALNRIGIDTLIVDLGGNGGGSDWVDAVARILAGKQLRAPRMGFIRHQHWTRSLERRLKDVSEDLARKDLTRQQTEYLKTARQRLQQALKETQTLCDKSTVWSAASRKGLRRRAMQHNAARIAFVPRPPAGCPVFGLVITSFLAGFVRGATSRAATTPGGLPACRPGA